MFLKYLQIVNYKNIKSSRFEFNKGANTIIGENDSGKSNAMTALRILLDSNYYYTTKRLKETDFSKSLDNWKGHWIIISAYFDEISECDKKNEICGEIIPNEEDKEFLKNYIRCEGYDYGTITLYIRPIRNKRIALATAGNNQEFHEIRNSISLNDYEFVYTSRSQTDFTDPDVYSTIVGDLESFNYISPEKDDLIQLGTKLNILDIWQHISVSFIDALRDVESELRKPKNPLRRVFDIVQDDILESNQSRIKNIISELNKTISTIQQVSDIGEKVNKKLEEIVGLSYSPQIYIESKLKEDIQSLAKYLSVLPSGYDDIDLLGLGHLNILYIALKLVEFEYVRKHEIINIMLIEEPEAHIHTHIQKALFDNLKVSIDYTQVIMSTHSTHLSEVADINNVNVISMSSVPFVSEVMRPTNKLNEFGNEKLNLRDLTLSECIERYLDAKRSVLLFSKGVILVEGDSEEILIPAMVKRAFGISLDEIGIGLVNIGSVSFEYIASIFAPDRLHRYCAIITDSDTFVEGASKSNVKAHKIGDSRKDKITKLFEENPWVQGFYASHTFEVDFANEEPNRIYIEKVIKKHYEKEETKTKYIQDLNGSLAKRYDSVLTLASNMGKGWYATVLSSVIDDQIIIPEYIIRAIVYASQEVVTESLIKKMLIYVLDMNGKDEKTVELKREFKDTETNMAIYEYCKKFPKAPLTKFIKCREELNNHD